MTGSASPAAFTPVPGTSVANGRTTFRVWAPKAASVELVLQDWAGPSIMLESRPHGFHEITVPVGAGTRYGYRLDDGEPMPDLASRFQPDGPEGLSEVIDPNSFVWTDTEWTGLQPLGQIAYEMHVGTFTPQGTWLAAADQLPALVELGVTVVEMMPVAEFPGQFGWGYDGVLYFAPTRLYGRPDDLRSFVDRAHGLGLGVILDVVYNHAGPEVNWFRRYANAYIGGARTEWGDGFNFDGEHSRVVRAFFEANAASWIREFHFDGLRLDATQQIFDTSTPHIVQTITEAARQAAGRRTIWMVAENEPQDSRLLLPARSGGQGLDALWNDDFHHAARVAATGAREAYYSDYEGTAQELVSCATRGFLYQGQRSRWQKKARGSPAHDLPPHVLVAYLQNHDQVANSIDGRRLHALTSPGVHRALTALLLLGPWTPLLFQGQEFAASAPFLYFADHGPGLAEEVARGRAGFLSQFPSIRDTADEAPLRTPHAMETFAACRLDHDERQSHRTCWQLHRDLIDMRRSHQAFRAQAPVAGAVLGRDTFALRFAAAESGSPDGGDRLVVINLARQTWKLESLAEPLLAPPLGAWRSVFSTDAPRYGGPARQIELDDAWILPPECAVVLR